MIDGTDEHEEGLQPAAQLALQLKIPMLLFTAIPPSDCAQGRGFLPPLPSCQEPRRRSCAWPSKKPLATCPSTSANCRNRRRGHRPGHARDPPKACWYCARNALRLDRPWHARPIAMQAFWSESMTPQILHQARASFLLAPGEGDPLLPPPRRIPSPEVAIECRWVVWGRNRTAALRPRQNPSAVHRDVRRLGWIGSVCRGWRQVA